MVIKKLPSIFIGAVLWGLGANLNIGVALGKFGLLAFVIGAILAVILLIRKGLQENQSNKDLWILIFRGLAIEVLAFPLANLIMEYMLINSFPYDETKALLIQSGSIALIMGAAFLYTAHLLNRKRHLIYNDEEKIRTHKESRNKRHV